MTTTSYRTSTDSIIQNNHITSGNNILEGNKKLHWEKSKTLKSALTNSVPLNDISSDLEQIKKPYFNEGNVKVFGRTRVVLPFARTRSNAFHYEHNADILRRYEIQVGKILCNEPNPTKYFPYSDSWKKKANCGIILETSTFKSESPIRHFLKELYKQDEKNMILNANEKKRPKPSIIIRKGTFPGELRRSPSPQPDSNIDRKPSTCIPSSVFLTNEDRKSVLMLDHKSEINKKNVEYNYTGVGNYIEKKSKNSDEETLNNTHAHPNQALKVFDTYFDDSDGESWQSTISKNEKKYKKLNKFRKMLRQDQILADISDEKLVLNVLNSLNVKDINSPTNTTKNQTDNNNINSHASNNHSDVTDNVDSSQYVYDNFNFNKEMLFSLRDKRNTPGITIGKSTRKGSWMGAKGDAHIMRRERLPDGIPVILMGSPHEDRHILPQGKKITIQLPRGHYMDEDLTTINSNSRRAVHYDNSMNDSLPQSPQAPLAVHKTFPCTSSSFPTSPVSFRPLSSTFRPLSSHSQNNETSPKNSSLPSCSSFERPNSAPRLFEWQPNIYQSKSILQKKYDDREFKKFLLLNKQNSNLKIVSTIEEKYESMTDDTTNDNNNSNNNDNNQHFKKNIMIINETRSSILRNIENDFFTRIKNKDNGNIDKNRALYLNKKKGDALGTHFKKKVIGNDSQNIQKDKKEKLVNSTSSPLLSIN